MASNVDLGRFFEPRSMAIVGAHDTRAPLDAFTQRLMARAESLKAQVRLVNPTRKTVFGIETYDSVADVPGEIDLVVIMVGDPVAVLEEAFEKRPSFALVFAAGFDETGSQAGRERTTRLLDAAARSGTRVVGPNTMISSHEVPLDLPGPRISAVTQSGARGRPISRAQQVGLPLRFWGMTGNESDLEIADFIEFFAQDASTDAILCYVEGFKDGARFRSAALDAIENGTPIAAIKVGRTEQGALGASSHTAHLTGSDAVNDAMFRQYGITRAEDIDELIDLGMVLSRCPIPGDGGLAIMCQSGGAAVHLVDLAVMAGVPIADLLPETEQTLLGLVEPGLPGRNPVDVGVTLLSHGVEIVEVILADPTVAALVLPIPGVYGPAAEALCRILEHAYASSTKPIIVVWEDPSIDDDYRQIVDVGLPVTRNLRNAVAGVKALFARRALGESQKEFVVAARALGDYTADIGETTTLSEAESAALLSDYGVPFIDHRCADDVNEAVVAAESLGYPVVLKACGRSLEHKSDLGFVAVDLSSETDLRAAAERMGGTAAADEIDHWIVAEMAPAGIELIAGISRDPTFGPVIAIGLGGVTAELIGDVSISVLPLQRGRAHQMLDELTSSPVLDGYRGGAVIDRDRLVDVIMSLTQVAADPEIVEVDVNPLLATAHGVFGLDALVTVARSRL